MKLIKTKYYWDTEYRCVNCKEKMSYYNMMYSMGRCFSCGYKAQDAITICDCDEIPVKITISYFLGLIPIKTIKTYK